MAPGLRDDGRTKFNAYHFDTPSSLGADKMNLRTLMIATAALSAVAGAAAAQTTATAPVRVNLVTPASVTHVAGTALDFGTLSRTGTAASTITIDGDAAIVGTPTTFVASGTRDAAEFNIAGFPNQQVDIAVTMNTQPATGITVTPSGSGANQALDGTGAMLLKVGGTLAIAAGTTVDQGNYNAGELQVTVSYN